MRRALRTLLATDGSVEAGTAVALLRALALPAGTQAHVLSVVGEAEQDATSGASAVRAAARALSRVGLAVTTEARAAPAPPVEAILEAVGEQQAGLVVMGAHGRHGLSPLLLGNTTRAVAHRSPVPVLVARRVVHGLRSVVLATDGSAPAVRAARFLRCLGLPDGARLTITHILPSRPGEPDIPEHGRDTSDAAAEDAGEARRDAEVAAAVLLSHQARLQPSHFRVRTLLRSGDPAGGVLRLIDEAAADLVVVGARRVSPAPTLPLGSLADRVLTHAPCSVLLVP